MTRLGEAPHDRSRTRPSADGWSSAAPDRRPRDGRRLAALGCRPAPAPSSSSGCSARPPSPPVRGDELSDAKAHQAQLKKDVADQKAQIAKLNAAPGRRSHDEIQQTTPSSRASTPTSRGQGQDQRNADQDQRGPGASTTTCVGTARRASTRSSPSSRPRRSPSSSELAERKALLAERVRDAYDTDRTSLLETFLSGGTFTDLLTEMSYYIDVGEQDKALAEQIAQDQETLAAIHQTVAGHARPDRRAAPARRPPRSAPSTRACSTLKTAKAAAQEARERDAPRHSRPEGDLRQARAQQGRRQEGAGQGGRGPEEAARARSASSSASTRSPAAAASRRSTTARSSWPMAGDVTQNFGCTGFSWEPPLGICAHFHNGHRHRRPDGHAGPRRPATGVVAYIGWNYADGPDPAWIVDHRPQPGPPDLVRPHVSRAIPRPRRQHGRQGPGHRLRGQHRALDRRAPPLGRVLNGTSSTRGCSSRRRPTPASAVAVEAGARRPMRSSPTGRSPVLASDT